MTTEKKMKILAAARSCFFRYGYGRVTMNDISSAAGMSRPALYLAFASKEDIFLAVLTSEAEQILSEIHAVLPTLPTAQERLRYAFDRWVVQPYVLLTQSPDARDLVDCTLEFVKDTVERLGVAFEEELVTVIGPLAKSRSTSGLSPAQLAHISVGAAAGFKKVARNVEELQELVWGQLAIVLASLADESPRV